MSSHPRQPTCRTARLLVLIASLGCFARAADDVLCHGGSGIFDGEFQGQKVHIGAAKNGGLATRTCEALLGRGEQTVVVATGMLEADLDAFGTDLGLGAPVAAFQLKKSDGDCCRSYEIYSLQKHPQLLRTIEGGSSFRASDVDLDNRVEIWTDDAAAINQFENFSLSEFDFVPTTVLRFEHKQLLDVSSEFQSSYDHAISEQRAKLEKLDPKAFKESDGRLAPDGTIPAERMHRLRQTKIAVLEIIWAYLYSGREQQAWATLTDFWPEKDAERIRGEIVKARNRGIRSQLDGTATTPPKHRKLATIYDATSPSNGSELVPPQAISLWRPPPQAAEQHVAVGETFIDLVIDSAGKVRSAELAGNEKLSDSELMKAAMQWTFVPAFKSGRAVASRTRLATSTRR